MINISNLCVVFNQGTPLEKIALNNFNLEVNNDDFICILGSNGAGKSTLFNSLLGKIQYGGNIYIDSKNIDSLKDYKRAKDISVVYQDPVRGTSPNLTVFENILLANRNRIKNKKAYKEKVINDLSKFEIGLETQLDKSTKYLSGGQRQVLSLYMATLSNPKVLLLDEHTAALDPKTETKVMEITSSLVKENHISTLMITHNLKTALDYGNRLIILNNGKVVLDISGELKKNMTESELLKTYSNSFSDVTLLNK